MRYYLYILRSTQKETYYIGISSDPERRVYFHNRDECTGYTRRYRPWELVFKCAFDTKGRALKAERKIKGWKSKKMVRLIIEGEISIEDYLK